MLEFLSSTQTINNNDVIELETKTIYIGNTLTNLGISVPSVLDMPFSCQMYFTVENSDLIINYTDVSNLLRFSGDDCQYNNFIPTHNKRYSLTFNYDGIYLNVYVQATSPDGFFSQGYVKSDGTMSIPTDVDHDKYITTDFIDGGQNILIQLNEYFYIHHIAIYSADNDETLNYDLQNTRGPRRFGSLSEYSICLPKSYKIKLSIVKNETFTPYWDNRDEGATGDVADPEQIITPDVNAVKKLLLFDEKTFIKMPSSDPHYEDALLRAQHLNNLSHVDLRNNRMFLGIDYSDQNEVPRLGLDVSPYTFATCWANPRGVMYTENVHIPSLNGHSEYGYDYTNAYTGSSSKFYGTSCSNSVDFILGRTRLNVSGEYRPGGRAGCTKVTLDENYSQLKPLDIVVRQGHVFIVMAVYKNANGGIEIIQTSESGGGSSWSGFANYTLESFKTYVETGEYMIVRLPGNIENDFSESLHTYQPNNVYDSFEPIEYNTDVCMMLGDKAMFFAGNPIFCNVNRGNGWEELIVEKQRPYKENVFDVFQTFDITDTTEYPTKSETGDWIDVCLNSYFPYKGKEGGKYRAYARKIIYGENFWDKTQERIHTPTNHYYFVSPNDNLVKRSSSTTVYNCWAFPCQPNTTYEFRISSQSAYGSTQLSVGWGKMADLSFITNETNGTLQAAVRGVTTADDQLVSTITTGDDATYLFMSLSDNMNRCEIGMNSLTIKTVTILTSKPTMFEVASAWLDEEKAGDWYCFTVENWYGNPKLVVGEAASGWPTTYSWEFNSEYRGADLNSYKTYGLVSDANFSNPHLGFRVLGEYGVAKYKYKDQASNIPTRTNYYVTGTKTSNTRLDTDGSTIASTYHDVIEITVTPGTIYRYMGKRAASTVADEINEAYAFYDSNDQLLGTEITLFYDANHVPANNGFLFQEMKAPANATKLKVAILKSNRRQVIYQPLNTFLGN